MPRSPGRGSNRADNSAGRVCGLTTTSGARSEPSPLWRLKHWFGVSAGVVWKWRKAFGVGGARDDEGSKRSIRAAARLGAEAMRAQGVDRGGTRHEGEPPPGGAVHVPGRGGHRSGADGPRHNWRLLGTDHDEAIAKKLGRTAVSAVASQRMNLKIPAFSGWPGGGPEWKAEELALLGTDTDAVVAKRVGRTRSRGEHRSGRALKVREFSAPRRDGAVR